MSSKIISKILTVSFIVAFAYIGVTINYTDIKHASHKSMKESYLSKNTDKDSSFTSPEITEPIPQIKFYKDSDFYFKATFGGLFGYILKSVLDGILIGIKFIIGKIF